MNGDDTSIHRAISKFDRCKVVKASRSTGSFLNIYFDDASATAAQPSITKLSIMIEFAEWSLDVKGAGVITSDSDTSLIDRTLPFLVGRDVVSAAIVGAASEIKLNEATMRLAQCESASSQDQAWTLFDDSEADFVESWTLRCDGTLSYWKGKRPRSRRVVA